MKKRNVLKFLLLLGTAAFVCGCGKGDTQTADTQSQETAEVTEEMPSGNVTLKVWSEEIQFEMVQQMIDSFKQEYSGKATFDITIEPMAEGETKNFLLGDVHNGADVFVFPDDQINSMVAAGALDSVSDETIKTSNIEAAVNAATINGTLYGYPMTADNGYFLYYDPQYFSPDDVTNLDTILAICEANEKQFSMDFTSGWYLYSFFGNTGLEMGMNDDGISNYCNWNSTDTAVKGVDIAQALLDITANPAFTVQSDDSFVEGARNGSVIAGISGTWNAKIMSEIWGKDYGACKLPTYTCNGQQIQMASFTGYKMMGVNYYSENKEWAHKLASWMTYEQNQKLRFDMMNTGPANINASASDEVAQVPAIKAVVDQSQFGVLQRVGNSYWSACTSFAETIAAGNPTGIPLQDIMDKLNDGITQ